MKKPIVLAILDGWGSNHHEEQVNAIKMAKPKNFLKYIAEYPNTELRADGEFVGLPEGQMGNSEVGHLNIGAGRVVYQLLPLISKEIREGIIINNKALSGIMETTKDAGKALHIMGLLSDGGVHSHILHMIGLVEMAKKKGLTNVYVHAILDGRDTPPQSSYLYLEQMEKALKEIGIGKVASISGRYTAMDRDTNWTRTKETYDMMTKGIGEKANSTDEAIKASYAAGINDEFVKPTNIVENGNPVALIEAGDGIIFANFRPDRARQLTRAFVDKEFKGFERVEGLKVNFVCLGQYDATIDAPVAYPPAAINNGFGEVVSRAGLKQIRTAETEKYAHVTFFFNGGKEEPYPGEIRLLSDSPKVATYDLKPEMSAYEVKDKLIAELSKGDTDTVILNFANPDMVGHTGNIEAVIKALTVVDECVGEIVDKVLEMDGAVLITADHGNADLMVDPETGAPFTAHTTNPVPLIVVSNRFKNIKLRNDGKLADITPTMLNMLEVEKPAEMTGESLIIK